MALTAKMVASEILMCGVKLGLKQIPIVGEAAASVVDRLQKRHESLSNADMLAQFESQLSRVERGMRDTVEKEIRTILANLGRPGVPGPELTREMTELRQIHEQGWAPNLFEGILRNSTHWEELKRNPKAYGRILDDHEPVDPENGMHLLLDKDKTRILEMPASSLAFLLGNQAAGIPEAKVRAGQDIWAFPASLTTTCGVTMASGAAESVLISIAASYTTSGDYRMIKGELKLTNKRLLFVAAQKTLLELDYEQIKSGHIRQRSNRSGLFGDGPLVHILDFVSVEMTHVILFDATSPDSRESTVPREVEEFVVRLRQIFP